jgi:cytochrome c1
VRYRLALLVALALVGGCERADVPAHLRVAGGDPEAGRVLIAAYGCNACHRIPGIRQANGRVGPPLDGFGRRAYIAGRLPNRPAMLTTWLRDPTAIDPLTAMPAVGLSEAEARHIAAYLYTLR